MLTVVPNQLYMPVETNLNTTGVLTITFATPAHNSLPASELQALVEAINAASANPDCGSIILRSGGDRTFCAGASFDELLAVTDEASGAKFFSGFASVINAARRCAKPIVGRVQGKAVGGGVGLISACDLVYASKFASVRLSELAIGIGPFVIGPAVERKVGTAAFSDMALRPDEWFPAAYAKTHGLYTEVLNDVESLDQAVATRARALADYHPEAVHELKRVLWDGTDHWDDLLAERAALSGRLVTRPFARAAIEAVRS